WANGLSAGETESSLEYAFFGIMIELTDAGQGHMEEIVEFTFQYLNILRKIGVAEWIFNEVQAISETKFHFQDKIPPLNYVTNIASNMELYPPQDWLVASSLPSKFNPITIQMVLDQLVPNSSRWQPRLMTGANKRNVSFLKDKSEAFERFKAFKALVENETAYYAEVAGLYYSIDHTGTGFQVTITGYNHKMRILLEKIFEKIVHFEVKHERFSVIKEKVLKNYLNFKFQQPYQQALYYCSLLLEHRMWQRNEFLEVIPQIEADDLMKFAPRITSRTFFECYVAGNMTSKEAESLVEHIEDSLFNGPVAPCKPLFPSQHLERRIIKLDSGTNYYYPVEGLNEQDENSALHHYIQLEQDDLKINVELELFVLSAKQAAFHQLRSIEQLGYIVVLMKRNDSGIQGAQFIIQSTVKDPTQLDIRVESFLRMFESKLHAMPDDEFKSNVKALIDMKLEKHKNLREESSFYWREINDGTLKFDRKEVE
ncbi:hypothetical protein KI387_040346, partial [Taxus chinensis]